MTRNELLGEAVDRCLQEIYTNVQPSVKWEDFKKQCKVYSKKYTAWEQYRKACVGIKENPEKWVEIYSTYPADWKDKSITDCIGPSPYEFYYIPKEIMKDIYDSYVHIYKMDNHQNLLDIIEILKNYCKEPIVDKYIEGELREDGTRWPGHRGYDHPANLKKEILYILDTEVLSDSKKNPEFAQMLQNKFFEFLDMAGNFFNWNTELNSFGTSVYLGPSPSSNKEAVIDNWKKYRNQDIKIDEEKMLKDYYGEDD